MRSMRIVRSKTGDNFWLVGLDGEIVSEIANEAPADDWLLAFDSDQPTPIEVRADLASHAQFTI